MLLRDSWCPGRLLGALLLLTLLLSSCGPSLAKKPKEPLNTDCTEKDEILYYVERPYINDSACTRYAWSTVGYPTLYISQDLTKCDCKYSINETEYLNESSGVRINGTESYFSLAIVFTRLVEFHVDAKKPKSYTALNVTGACEDQYISMNLSNGTLDWMLEDDYTLIGEADGFSFSIKVHFPSAVGFERLSQFPRAQVSENATLVDITIKKYKFHNTSDAVGGRLALELFVVHGPNVKAGQFQQDQTLDDEYTPSVFSSWTYNVSGNVPKFHDLGGYIHWKPISYQSKARKSTESQQVNMLPTAEAEACMIPNACSLKGLAADLYCSSASNVTRWYAVFGTDGDDTYLSPGYSTWTLVVGYGKVPHDGLSFTVIITIIVGLGVPGALVVLGGVYVFIKKKPWQNLGRMMAKVRARDGYQQIH